MIINAYAHASQKMDVCPGKSSSKDHHFPTVRVKSDPGKPGHEHIEVFFL